jgi:hypothetical protein
MGSDDKKTADLGDVRLDLDRSRRCGFPEVVFGEAKSVETLQRVVQALVDRGEPVLVTRVADYKGSELEALFPHGKYNPLGRTFRIDRPKTPPASRPSAGASHGQPATGRVAVVTAGTSDMAVAEEVRETLVWMGVECELVVDVGVAGPHRLQEALPRIRGSDAVVVVAGMEAALASVVGGHVDCPVIAVPTSVGYGASLGGIAALLGMLNSCAANVCVVNIDAGFKGGYIAGMIARGRG